MEMLTVLSALKAQAGYSLPDAFFVSVMMRRGLDDTTCTQDILNSGEFRGCLADCLWHVATGINSMSEGDLSVSVSDSTKALLKARARSLYREIGETAAGDERPRITCY